ERELRVQVLTHQAVLDLAGLTQQIHQLLPGIHLQPWLSQRIARDVSRHGHHLICHIVSGRAAVAVRLPLPADGVHLPGAPEALILSTPGIDAAGAVADWCILVTRPLDEAFGSLPEWVPVDDMRGRVAAVVVVPYPPGIPLLMPGEQAGPYDG